MKNNLILIGYMGCGKTTVGRWLAERLGLPFVDTDQWIETKEGCKISRIFSRHGEEAFRAMETDCLKELLAEGQRAVFSVGGGLPLREENRELLGKLGTVVYLRTTPETIYSRLETDTERPLLQTGNRMDKIREMLRLRQSFYEAAAQLTVDTDGKTPEAIADEILGRKEKG